MPVSFLQIIKNIINILENQSIYLGKILVTTGYPDAQTEIINLTKDGTSSKCNLLADVSNRHGAFGGFVEEQIGQCFLTGCNLPSLGNLKFRKVSFFRNQFLF